MSTLVAVLHKFSRKEASIDDVMRAMTAYEGWYAPMAWAAKIFETNLFENACLWGAESNAPPGKLMLFTDGKRGLDLQARGVNAGPYVGPVRGDVVFANIPDGLSSIEINPGSAVEDGFFLGGEGAKFARAWGRAAQLESALTTGKDVANRLIDFDAYGVLVTPQGAVATAVGAAGMKNPGLVFTASDCLDTVCKSIGPSAKNMTRGVVTGEKLFTSMASFGVDGYILNAMGPGPCKPLTMDLCQSLADMIAGRVELARLEALARGES
jgi:hypothetical protein